MFEGFKRFWKGFMQMFGYMTLKQIVGKDITLSDKMIDAINEWKQMLNGQADWITDSIVSLGIEEGGFAGNLQTVLLWRWKRA